MPNAAIRAEEVGLIRRSIARLKRRQDVLDVQQAAINNERAFISNELMHQQLALKHALGLVGETPDTSLEDQPAAVASVTSSNRQDLVLAGTSSDTLDADVTSALVLADTSSPPLDAAVASTALVLTDIASTSLAATACNTRQVLASARYEITAPGETVELTPRIGKVLSDRPLISVTRSGFTDLKNRVRCVDFLSTNPDGFVTSYYNGVIDIWELKSDILARLVYSFKGELHGSPEQFAINPMDDSLILRYGQKGKLALVSLSGRDKGKLKEMPVEPTEHETGVTQIAFLNCQMNTNPVFVSSGRKDHKIVPWTMVENNWNPASSYKAHTSDVTGICGLYGRAVVASCGRDKLGVAYDLEKSLIVNKVTTKARCAGVAANPNDFNLLCLQTSADERQLKLWDVRTKNLEKTEYGWRKSHSEKETALVKPVWSPSGLLLSSGTAENTVCVFDIRFCRERNPMISIEEHSEKVYKVAWAPTRPILLTTSLDRKIGLHLMIGPVVSDAV